METIQLCPPTIRESIAITRTAIEDATQISPERLALGAEAAEVMGALTDDAVLATAVLAKPAVGLPGITPEKLARLVGYLNRAGDAPPGNTVSASTLPLALRCTARPLR